MARITGACGLLSAYSQPQARIVEAYVLSRGEYGLLGIYKDEDVIQSQVLAGIAIVANSLFV